MKQRHGLLQRRSLLTLVVMLLMSLMTLSAWAADQGQFATPAQAFTWYSKGQGCLHFKLQTTNASPYRTLHSASYYLRDADGNKTEVFYVGESNSENSGYVISYYKNSLPDESLLWLTNDTNWKPLCYIYGGSVQEHHTTRNGKDDGYAELDWYFPTRFAGKRYTFCVEATLWYQGGSTEPYNKDIGIIEFEEISFETYDPFPSTENGEAGIIKVPFVSDRPINYVDATYEDSDGNTKSLARLTLPKNTYNGFLQFPATEKHHNIKITANVLSGAPSESDIPNPGWPKKCDGNVTKTIAKVGQIHNPRMLRADLDSVGGVKLRWIIGDTDDEDLLDTDAFQIQRSLTGKLEDFQTLQTDIIYDAKQTIYSFRDSTLISALTAEQIDEKLGIPLVRYRVLRAATAQLWGADKDPTAAYAQPRMSTLALMTPVNGRANWQNSNEKTVKVEWDWAQNEKGRYYVWDDRAVITLETQMFNQAGELVDAQSTEVTKEQRDSRQIVVKLSNSCVKYQFQIKVDASKSPVGKGKGKIFTTVSNVSEWCTYVTDSVLAGKSPNVILTGDFTVPFHTSYGPRWIPGYHEYAPFRGNLNGNGHKIQMEFDSPYDKHALMFHLGDGAVIGNLHVSGFLRPHEQFAGTLASQIMPNSSVSIENCHITTQLQPEFEGEGSHGGLVGIVKSTGVLRITNTLFDGDFKKSGYVNTNNGGFIGWRESGALAIVNNCRFSPTTNDLSTTGSATFIHGAADAVYGFIQDCTYKTAFGTVQGKQSNTVPQNWCWKDGQPEMVTNEFSTPSSGNSTTDVKTPSDGFYYQNIGYVLKESLKTTPQQNAVLLEWEVTENAAVDYFTVYRRKVNDSPNSWEKIATQVTVNHYEDQTASPVYTYYYKVASSTDCQGKHVVETDPVEGHCIPTGRVTGFVRFADGTGIPDITVNIIPANNKGQSFKVVTDERGYFQKDGIPYWEDNKGSINTYSYTIAPDISGFNSPQPLSFGTEAGKNVVTDLTFTITESVTLSGYVLYDGTSIPVQGVSFFVDGFEVRNAGGKVTTDFEGKFTIRMLKKIHSIQAYKDGHVFYQDGYYHENDMDPQDKVEYDWTTNKAGYYFYDKTRVKLIGRVAGGKEQGAIPLDNSLSKNNLGDDLKMVFTLEGDKASRLVYDVQNRDYKERDTVFVHNAHDKKYNYKTRVHTTQHRMEIWPDRQTGEYQVWLPPVKWKVEQITARGYASLFQNGQINDVIDLSDSVNIHTDHYTGEWKAADGTVVKDVDVTYYAKYNRIFHNPVQIVYKQIGYEKFEYFGDHYYTAKSLIADPVRVPLCYPVRNTDLPKKTTRSDTLVAKYTFGAPVFNIGRKYPFLISARETYYYNNNENTDTVDVVKLSGGFITIQNGMVSSTHRDTLTLNKDGEGTYYVEAAQTPYMLTGKEALRTLTMTMEMDGTYYEAKPLNAYVLNQYIKPGAKDFLTINKPLLIDVLRDPPGGTSSAKLSKGSTLKYAHELTWNVKGGLSITANFGNQLTTLTAFGIGTVIGTINNADSYFTLGVDLIWSGTGKEAWSYTMTNNVDISTSSATSMVGADADVYIGAETSYTLTPMVAIRAIPESMWKQQQGMVASGRLLEIAQGYSEKGDTLHLVREEMYGVGTKVNSTFAHSQQYIMTQLLPRLEEQCKALLFTGTKAEAQTLANNTGKNVYLSLRPSTDPDFGIVNTQKGVSLGDDSWSYYFNTTKDKAEDGINYLVVQPSSNKTNDDEIADYYQSMLYWAAMIAHNEKEKLTATELVRTFDLDGGSPMSYSEEFSSEYSESGELRSPIDGGVGQLAATALKSLANLLNRVTKTTKQEDRPHFGVEMPGYKFGMSFGPVLDYSISDPYSDSKKYTRKESFTIGMDRKSHLMFDVYRVKANTDADSLKTSDGKYDIFVNNNYYDLTNTVTDKVTHSSNLPNLGKVSSSDFRFAKGFVYRTRGGATCRPWEPDRTTNYYRGGTVMDERTKKIENPVMMLDRQSQSGVPYNEPARFKLYMANESELPEAAYGYWNLTLKENTNPNGAKLMIDGIPLSGNARVMEVVPGKVTEKTLEVYAGENFDYENIGLRLCSQGDVKTFADTELSVHFLQTAGNVEISTPGDKWIMNTDAPYDSIRGWYLPVVISGYNKTQKNFDHIEFQYKETTRGDDYWTNLCGFYADSTLYEAASGTNAMIPENGYINTKFYGEGKVMEKAYDLRAVVFVRNGNSLLTNSSKVLSGVKDTRRPQLFGKPDPKEGVLTAGESVVFHFSEGIESNYLQATTNFEVMGETNESELTEEPALLFGKKTYAQSEARRNFADKDMTVEVMIKPDQTGRDMPVFSHGTYGKQLQLWVTADSHLKAIIDGKNLVTKKAMPTEGFHQVAMVLNAADSLLILYGPNDIQDTLFKVSYSGYGPIIFGSTNQTDVAQREYYEGRMLQGRIWERALNRTLLNTYGHKLLTGYEMGLTDYYPMSEGDGIYVTDHALGAHLTLHGVTWALPRGMSLHLDRNMARDIKGLHVKPKYLQRTSEQDYTLMFWFRTNAEGHGALVSNGSGRVTDVDSVNKFFIGFEAEKLKYRSNGHEYVLGGKFDDGAWHHFAMTVNRSFQVANIYVDNDLKAEFTTEWLGGMTGDDFYLGNMVWHEKGAAADVLHQDRPLTGNLDGLILFEQALPPSLIKRYSQKAVGGQEKGLITFLGFSRQEYQKNGNYTLQPYVLNQKKPANKSEAADSVFYVSKDEALNLIDQENGAPMQAYQELRKLNFSYVGRNNQLLVNIDETDARINKRQVHITLFDIPDLNGNYMKSPATTSIFIDRNPLRWGQKIYKRTLKYNPDADYEFDVSIKNNSGASHTYKIESLPKWLKAQTYQDIIDAQDEQILTFYINKDTNVGEYDDIIYLTDENGLSESLVLDITIEGETPVWEVDPDMKQFSMSMVAKVMIGDDIITDSRDVVGAFSGDGTCMGMANIKYNTQSNESMVYLTIFNKTDESVRPMYFKLWHYQTGKTMVLTPSKTIEFTPNAVFGWVKDPIILKAGSTYVQQLELKQGWNWMSFNIYNNTFAEGFVRLIASYPIWSEGDCIVDATNNLVYSYKQHQWLVNDTKKAEKTPVDVTRSYRIYIAKAASIEMEGSVLKNQGLRTIQVKNGWNHIGFTPMVNLPVTTALADYLDEAVDGDVIKSQTEFAQFSVGANGKKSWNGNLEYMKPGQGYMLYRTKANAASFKYPFYEPNATFFESTGGTSLSPVHDYVNTMSLTAMLDGVDVQSGDKLIAISGGEVRGEANATDSLVYMSIGGDNRAPIMFLLERDGSVVASSGEVLTYETNAVSGSYGEPTYISFIRTGQLPQHGWYTVQGIKLQKAPVHSGVYIYNGHKVVIK